MGIIRNFDKLGRIVIPKEIRDALHLQNESPVEISVNSQSIILEKHYKLKGLRALCNSFLKAYIETCSGVCVICSTEQVLAVRGISLSTDIFLSSNVSKCIGQLEIYLYDEQRPLTLTGHNKYLIEALYPIGTLDTPLGAVILLHYGKTSSSQLDCAKLLASLLTEITVSKVH